MKGLKVTGKQDFMGKIIPVVLGGFGEGKKCIADKTVAEIHRIKTFHVRELIANNIKRFIENVDFIDLKQRIGEDDTLKLLQNLGYVKQSITQAERIYVLSERGYAKLIKIMDSDLAWEIHDKLIDEYFQLRDKHKSSIELLELEFQAIKEVDDKVNSLNEDYQQFKKDMPILGIEESRITNAVKKMGVRYLGGKNANAYKESSLRGKLYRDIYNELYRQFGITTYKAIKRSQCDLAIEIINSYEPPLILAEAIGTCNAQENLEEAVRARAEQFGKMSY